MFWLHEEDLPAGTGSEPFCAAHLAYIAVFLAATILYALLYRRMDEGRRKTADRILGSLVFFFGLCEYGISALLGRFSLYSLPLHVCSLMFTISLIHAWTNDARPGSFAAGLHDFLGAVIFLPGIIGTWAALLFPDWLVYPFRNYMSISCFLAHGLISVYGASVLVKIAEAPEPGRSLRRDLLSSVLFMAAGAVLMYLFDRATGTNYWFLAGPGDGSPFTGVYAGSGYSGYIIAYAFTAAVITAIWYALRYVIFVRKK